MRLGPGDGQGFFPETEGKLCFKINEVYIVPPEIHHFFKVKSTHMTGIRPSNNSEEFTTVHVMPLGVSNSSSGKFPFRIKLHKDKPSTAARPI